ncbi:diadenylate cyclase CdaA [Anaeromyxobacter paludicola]|uniref:Diadenylate cyclase n=1 Tax=Anaeromyxobacter paludicola TaxID=2918171 RepID=A0ABM7X7Q8_9BACT|nr:diadenylate cyclase CdaA [Anaeromyxobacter paludicola]BDG07852.1 membrane protein [Anaeromyxobacter paludicola]
MTTEALDYLLGPGTRWRDLGLAVVDTGVVSYLFYRMLLLIRGTKALNVLVGLSVLGVAYLASQLAGLVTLNWLLGHFLTYSFMFGVIVLFQADIRRGLAHLGGRGILSWLQPGDRAAQVGAVEAVVRASVDFSRRKVGALIVFERLADLYDVMDTGVRLDSALTPELLGSIFHNGGPLHDGAVVIQRGRIVAARCLLPLTQREAAPELGTRHRAALGLAEEVDAAVVVVSEERGEISLAVDGQLTRRLDEHALRERLLALLVEDGPSRPAAAPRSGPRRKEPRAAI